MIVFKGDYSEKNLKILWKQNAKNGIILIISVCLLLLFATIICSLIWEFNVISGILIAVCIVIILLSPLNIYEAKKKAKQLNLFQIIIDNGEMEVYFSEFISISLSLSNINKIIEKDDCYLVYRRGKFGYFLIQKDLIVIGTIEEFERIYAEKLIKN